MRKLTTDEYFKEEEEFFKKFNEYTEKKIDINRREHEFIENIDGCNLTYSEKSDIYFDKYKDVVEKFEKEREENFNKYGTRYNSLYNTDFYTELNQEFIDRRMKEFPDAPDNKTLKSLLEDLNKYKGKYFVTTTKNKPFKLEFIGIQVDDYYYVGISDDGEYCWYSAVVMPDFVSNCLQKK